MDKHKTRDDKEAVLDIVYSRMRSEEELYTIWKDFYRHPRAAEYLYAASVLRQVASKIESENILYENELTKHKARIEELENMLNEVRFQLDVSHAELKDVRETLDEISEKKSLSDDFKKI